MPSHLMGPVKYIPNNEILINKEQEFTNKRNEIIDDELGLVFKNYPIEDDYELLNDLGSGQFALVKKVRHRTTGQHYAAKFVKKRRFATSRRGVPRAHIEREIEILRLVGGHKNVIQLYNVFETSNEIIMILELIGGGELFDYVCEKDCLPEEEAVKFVKEILEGVKHLHENMVCHLDIKPENIMLLKKGESNIKLIDFGLSRVIRPGFPIKDMIGTPEFVAPEIINYEFLSSATDMWAIGVVTYILLSNGSPFLGHSREETFSNITAANYDLSDRYFSKVSIAAKHFIKNLLVINKEERMTAIESLNHSWIRGYFPPDKDITIKSIDIVEVLKRKKLFNAKEYWNKIYMKIRFINRLTMKARREIEEAKASDLPIETKYDPEEYIISAVLIACEEGNLVGLEQLVIRHEVNLNVANKLGETSMHIASGSGHDKVVLYLRSQGVPVDVKDRRGDTPLFWAARNGHNNILKLLSKDKGVNINHINKSGETALHVATRYSQFASVQTLLECGANLNIQDEHGESPLHIASWHGYSNSLDILCRYNPNIKITNQVKLIN
uniref:Protein kinase domain-containing protein n=1 Tax=Parastrongyloides trichosuri TaxID=131310 RepID=A0A0N4ZXD3_PARTI